VRAMLAVIGWGTLFLVTEFMALVTTIGVLSSYSMPWGHMPSVFLAVTVVNALAVTGAARFRSARPVILLAMVAALAAGMWQADAPARACGARAGSYSYMEGCSD
jgi:hypothetical protein